VPVIHAVTDDRVLSLPDFLARARALALGPAYAIHLRGSMAGGPLLALAERLRSLTAPSGTRLLIHDRLDVARLAGADGVHLPAAGLPPSAVRTLLGPEPLLGRSTHSAAEAREAAAARVDYVFLGNIWETASHPGRPPLGAGAIRDALPAPVIAIGGVTPETAPLAAAAGAAGAAAIRAIWDAADPAAAARALRVCFSR
jgi:thiamine-phosphate pyrophosphorylase